MGTVLDYFTGKQFVGAKPREEITPRDLKRILSLQTRRRLHIQRKRDGYGTYIPISGSSIGLYSRLNTPWTGKFPNLERELRGMQLPDETILCGEMLVRNKKGDDDPHLFGRFARTNRDGSVLLQKGYDPVHLALFDVLKWGGRDVSALPYEERLHIVKEICAKERDHISVAEHVDHSFADAQEMVKRMRWEGLILRDLDAGTSFRTDGNSADPPRPDGTWKKKPFQEADFIAVGWIPSTSKSFKGLVRDFILAQYDSHTGELVEWGAVGNGLTVEQKRFYADDSRFPLVVQVQFELRTKNNRLQKASIMRVRDDKLPAECRYPILLAA